MNENRSTGMTLRLVRSPAEPAPTAAGSEPIGRIVGLDLARALAVFGMYYAHVAPRSMGDGFGSWLMELPHGRSSALFATLAGLSLVLLAGGNRPKTGREGRRSVVKIAIRAVILLALGTALTVLGTSVAVILAFYGLYFLLALPFMRLRARTLAVLAAVCAIGGSILRLWSQSGDMRWVEPFYEHDPLASWGADGILSLFLFGFYPAVSWMAYVFAGMAIGKLDLAAKANRIRLAVVGPALALIGYGGAWLISRTAGLSDDLSGWQDFKPDMSDEKWQSLKDGGSGEWMEGDPDKLSEGQTAEPSGFELSTLVDVHPHSGTPFELVGNIGVAIAVIVASVVLLARFGRVRRLLTPITAVGTMSLTAYLGHIVILWFLFDRPELPYEESWAIWGCFVAGAVVFAFGWSRFFKRGPLEYGMAAATRLARLVK